jgi:large subunit ribosomal protein L15
MTVHKKKKNRRFRGSKTHGAGIGSKHNKGAGSRGGRGMAGTGKRADQKKPSIWKERYFGKPGFSSKSRTPESLPINIKTIEDRLDMLVRSGKARLENGAYTIDLAELGYNKLLSCGEATKRLIITTDFASDDAVENVKKAGGDVKVLIGKKPRKEKKKAEQKEAPRGEKAAPAKKAKEESEAAQ